MHIHKENVNDGWHGVITSSDSEVFGYASFKESSRQLKITCGSEELIVDNYGAFDSHSLIYYKGLHGVFGNETRQSVISAQNTFGLLEDGVVGEITWNAIYNAYRGIVNEIPLHYIEGNVLPYPGVLLRIGSDNDSVLLLQQYINVIAEVYPEVNSVDLTGYFGTQTDRAVKSIQSLSGLEPNGLVGAITWDAITSLYSDIVNGSRLNAGQYPGFEIGGN